MREKSLLLAVMLCIGIPVHARNVDPPTAYVVDSVKIQANDARKVVFVNTHDHVSAIVAVFTKDHPDFRKVLDLGDGVIVYLNIQKSKGTKPTIVRIAKSEPVAYPPKKWKTEVFKNDDTSTSQEVFRVNEVVGTAPNSVPTLPGRPLLPLRAQVKDRNAESETHVVLVPRFSILHGDHIYQSNQEPIPWHLNGIEFIDAHTGVRMIIPILLEDTIIEDHG